MKSITSLPRAAAIVWLGIACAASRAQPPASPNPFGDRIAPNGMDPKPELEPDLKPEPEPERENPVVEPAPEIRTSPDVPQIHPEIGALQKMHSAWLETARKPPGPPPAKLPCGRIKIT